MIVWVRIRILVCCHLQGQYCGPRVLFGFLLPVVLLVYLTAFLEFLYVQPTCRMLFGSHCDKQHGNAIAIQDFFSISEWEI